jgi:hypothetical protein
MGEDKGEEYFVFALLNHPLMAAPIGDVRSCMEPGLKPLPSCAVISGGVWRCVVILNFGGCARLDDRTSSDPGPAGLLGNESSGDSVILGTVCDCMDRIGGMIEVRYGPFWGCDELEEGPSGGNSERRCVYGVVKAGVGVRLE